MKAVWSDLEKITVSARVVDKRVRSSHRIIVQVLYHGNPDFKAFEFKQQLVTEIDISTLDTVDLVSLKPGAKGMTRL